MRLHRFFISEFITEDRVVIKDANLLNQFKNVLRLKAGDRVVLFDGSSFEFECLIENFGQNQALLSVRDKLQSNWKEKNNLEILPALIKRDRFEWELEKLTELGVKKISPLISNRTIKQKLNLERSRKIIKESAEQSGKTKLPEICAPKKLTEAVKIKEVDKLYFALDHGGEKFFSEKLTEKNIGVFIGPEGGFTPEEKELFEKNGIPIYSLGQQILRAETAGLAIAAKLLLN